MRQRLNFWLFDAFESAARVGEKVKEVEVVSGSINHKAMSSALSLKKGAGELLSSFIKIPKVNLSGEIKIGLGERIFI